MKTRPKRKARPPRTPRVRLLPLPADDPFYTEPFRGLALCQQPPNPTDEPKEPMVFDMEEDAR